MKNFYQLESVEDSNDAKKSSNKDFWAMEESQLLSEKADEYEAFIKNVSKLDAYICDVEDEDNNLKYNIKEVVDNIKEAGEVLNGKEKEGFIKNVESGKAVSCFGINLKDFGGVERKAIAYQVYYIAWNIANLRTISLAMKKEKKQYYNIFGEDYI